MTICVDQTVPDVGESDLGPHDLPVCLYADVVLCVFYIRGSRNFSQGGGGGGREVRGSRQKKAPLPGKKTLASYFLVFSPNLQLLNCFTEGGGQIFFFDLILFDPSTIFQLYRGRSSWIEPVLSYDKCVLLKDHNAVTPVKLKAAAHMSRVKHSTTEPLCSQRWSDAFLRKLYNFPRFQRGFNILRGERGPTNSGGGGGCIETYRNWDFPCRGLMQGAQTLACSAFTYK